MPNVVHTFKTVVGNAIRTAGVRTVAFEVTQDCNQNCRFCYNVWKRSDYHRGQLDTTRTKQLIDRIIAGYRPHTISFTGGEPLLRPDIIDLISYAAKRTNCNLVTNGTLMTDDLASQLTDAGVKVFEFTLLSADRHTHNALVGRDSFDQLLDGIASVRAAGGTVASTFVATRHNIECWAETLELNFALGVSGVLFNRFNLGGEGAARAADLTPTQAQLRTALKIAQEGSRKYGMSISCGVPIPPCVIDRAHYPDIHFSECAAGTRNAYPAVDPLGNVRPCNHSALVLGNAFDNDIWDLLRSNEAMEYASSVPSECIGCKHVKKCRGGCRAAAEACGQAGKADPFVGLCKEQDRACAGCI